MSNPTNPTSTALHAFLLATHAHLFVCREVCSNVIQGEHGLGAGPMKRCCESLSVCVSVCVCLRVCVHVFVTAFGFIHLPFA